MDKIKVDTGKLQNTESSVRDQIRNIQASLVKMQKDVASLNAMWSGEANQSFNQTFQKDIADLNSLCNGLSMVADYEENARKEYAKCEEQVASVINSIRVS